MLKEQLERYGTVFTLYCFTSFGEFSISDIPDKFADEFLANSNHLRFGFNGKCENYPFAQETDYKQSFELFDNTVKRLGCATTNTLRLHHWQANRSQKEFLFFKRHMDAIIYV